MHECILGNRNPGLSIRMVAGFSEVAEGKDFLVAGGGFEPPTFGL
jgi:hypothetical protein